MAKRRMLCLVKKMNNDTNLARNLHAQIDDYIKKGYARKLEQSELNRKYPRQWYLPVFPVKNPNKPNKIRLVWDAAAKVDGVSLNSVLMKGPDLLTSLTGLLYRFRERKVAICADIEEMYHQVLIRPEDQHSQRFLWPNADSSKGYDVYVMQVMTFGAACSPSCAQYVKNQNAAEFQEQYPRAVNAIIKNHYVDDLLESLDTDDEAANLAQQVKNIHKKGGFNIRNWRSSSQYVLENIGESSLQRKDINMGDKSALEKVLGMWWCSKSDTFTYSLVYNKANKDVLSGKIRPTKRELLRTISSIFDPLGLLAWYLVHAKIILQEVWRSGIEWDEQIKDPQLERWLNWIKILPCVEKVQVPRWYMCGNKAELHVFVDASEDAYGAVAYLRLETDSIIQCALIGAKTRVAPLKMQSIPRLELEACLLGARFAKMICEGHSIEISKRWFWTDSRTALAWIKSDHRRYRQYVAFRVSEILDLSEMSEWRWIAGRTNVADELTKWHKNFELSTTTRWFKGPEFLHQSKEWWPNDNTLTETQEELKSHCLHINENSLLGRSSLSSTESYCRIPVGDVSSLIDSNRFSKYQRLVRVAAFVHRFVLNCLGKSKRYGEVVQEEYQLAENFLYRQAQAEKFSNERDILLKNQGVPLNDRASLAKDSPLLQCSPFVDNDGLLRVRSRIIQSEAPLDMKLPIILPKNSRITQLVVLWFHEKYHHINHETVVNELRQKFHIPQLRAVLKNVRRQCQVCKNASARPVPPEMAALPKARVTAFCRPFTFVGIDYFGPIPVSVGRRTEKRWGVLFTCLSIRALHIEIAHSLTTDSCIMCIENFINRRGQPAEFFSDNGTNFKGADSELQRAVKDLDNHKFHGKFTTSVTKWNFNPPLTPHMGGSWERLIRSVKTVLQQIKPQRTPTDELLVNMMAAVENMINSRPLTYMPLDTENDEALTPNHFLLGSSNGNKPRGMFSDDGTLWRKNWMKSQQYIDMVWRRWIREFLPTLTRRSKWYSPVKPLQKGDVVVIVDELLPRNCWPKGIVLDVIMSKDGQVRQATVQTNTGIYTRPAVKLAVLDVLSRVDGKPIPIDLPGGTVGNPVAVSSSD